MAKLEKKDVNQQKIEETFKAIGKKDLENRYKILELDLRKLKSFKKWWKQKNKEFMRVDLKSL